MSTEKLSELSKPVAWKFKNADGGDRVSLERKANIYGRHDFQPLYSQEYVSALLAELEKAQRANNSAPAILRQLAEEKQKRGEVAAATAFNYAASALQKELSK
ncbi:hypothetical protein QP585_22340 [Serratia ureilytica]|uniref:hypothetical protein n=1 Tax=Serratia ureilytica TaxID=300181 RepID=UPI00254D62BE|nr:hypothetical protein [Serratia ureilytica]MDK7595855.1 hypothetical protein [Serratia ureilytica]